MLVNQREKTGRNERCPCGSGKKYKHCCLGKAQVQDSLWQRVRAAFDLMQSRLAEFGLRRFGGLREFAWSDYYFGEPQPEDRRVDGAIFIPYFLFRWKPEGENLPTGDAIIAQAYLRLQGRGLSDLERQVVELGLSQPFTFYEVRSVVRGEEFVLKELFTGEESLVKERSGTRTLQPADILYGQLAPMQEITTMVFNAGFLIPPIMKPEIIMLRRELQDQEGGRALTKKDVLRYEDDLRELFFYIRDSLSRPPILQNTDGDPLALHTIHYEIGSAHLAFEALAPLAKVWSKEDMLEGSRYDAEGNLQEVTITWSKKGNRKIKSWDNTTLGTIYISGKSLRAEVNSKERAARIRHEIETRLGLAAVYKTTEVTPIDMDKIRKNAGTLPRRDETSEIMKDPEAQRIVREMMQKQLESWVRQKLPVLGGRTPLQAVRDEDGREMVEALLVQQERGVLRMHSGATRPDMSVVRRLLKLPPA